MRADPSVVRWSVALAAVVAGCVSQAVLAQSSTALTYQGELRSSGGVANGLHDFRFRLFTDASGSAQLGPTLCADNVSVGDGRFTVVLDFGDQFATAGRHLEIEVREDTGLGCGNLAGFTILGPRQLLTSAPAASFAFNAATLAGQSGSFFQNATNMTSGTLPAGRLAGTYTNALTFSNASNTFTGVGSGLTALNASNVTLGTLADARIPTTIPRLNLANIFSGPTNIFTGGVGVNTGTTLVADLQVRAAAGGLLGKLLVTPGISDSSSQIMLSENTTATLGAILRYDGTSNQVQLLGVTTGGVETSPHLIVGRDNGRLGIGIAPEARLHVANGSAGLVPTATDTAAVIENAGDAFLQFQIPDLATAGVHFGTPTRGASAARIEYVDTSTAAMQFFVDPAFATVRLSKFSITVGDSTHAISTNLNSSVSIRSNVNNDAMSYGSSSISFNPGAGSTFPGIKFADGSVTLVSNSLQAGWGEFEAKVSRSTLTSPLVIENVGGSSGQSAPVLRLLRAAADGERLLEMTSIAGTYTGFISRDGGGVAYLGFTGLHAAWGEGVAAGDLVVLTGGSTPLTPVEPGIPPEPVYQVARSVKPNEPGVLGVVRYPLDIERPPSLNNPWAVAAVGNAHVWIVETGRSVEPGDGLITSDVPGAAQLDDPERFEVGHIFARAAERVEWSAVAPGPDGRKRALVSVLLDASVRDSRPSAELAKRLETLEARLREMETLLGRPSPAVTEH